MHPGHDVRREYGSGTIYRTGDGRWRGAHTVGTDRRGVRQRRYVSGRSYAVVEARLDNLRNRILREDPARRDDPSVAEWLSRWLESMVDDLAPETHTRYSGLIRHQLTPALGGVLVRDLRASEIRAALSRIRRQPRQRTSGSQPTGAPLSASTVRQAYAVLRGALRAAVEDGIIASNPAAAVRRPRVSVMQQATGIALNLEETSALLETARKSAMPARWMLALTIGLRQAECLGITWDCLDTDNDVLVVRQQLKHARWQHGCAESAPCQARSRSCTRHDRCRTLPHCVFGTRLCPDRHGGGPYLSQTKTWKERTVTLPRFVSDELRRHRQRQETSKAARPGEWEARPGLKDLVFTGLSGIPLGARLDHERWIALVAQAAIRPVRLHDARHTAATVLTDQGLDTVVIQTMLGHSSAATTRRYQRTSAATTRVAAQRLDDLYAPASTDPA